MNEETKKKIRRAAGEVAKDMGNLLQQAYGQREGIWWLFAFGKPMRPLTVDEVKWHIDRSHAPFVENGITTDDPRWFNDSKQDNK